MTIAIAEDNTTTRRELSRLLTSHGYETVLPDDFKDLAGQLAGLSACRMILKISPVSLPDFPPTSSFWTSIFLMKTDMTSAGGSANLPGRRSSSSPAGTPQRMSL